MPSNRQGQNPPTVTWLRGEALSHTNALERGKQFSREPPVTSQTISQPAGARREGHLLLGSLSHDSPSCLSWTAELPSWAPSSTQAKARSEL